MAVDDIDQQILDILRHRARTPASEIARDVGLSAAAVSRRIERLERTGIIRGYAAIIEDHRAGSLEAFTEIRLAGPTETSELATLASGIPEVESFYTIAGDPDALIRIRATDVDDLQRVVNRFRATGKVTGTKTLIVLYSWSRDAGGAST